MITLQRPSEDLVSSYFEFVEEMRQAGEKVWEECNLKPGESPPQFVERLLRAETDPPAGLVPEIHYWAFSGDCVVGRIALRHILNDNLKVFGGHIGYEVRPSQRRKGFAREMLRLLLESPRALKIGRLLLTCAPDNIASNKTIVANGGVLEKTAYVEKWQRDTNYYWINL